MSTPRKTRSDNKVGTLDEELLLIKAKAPTGAGKTLASLEFVRKVPEGNLTEDQKLAAKVRILMHPKSKISNIRKIQQAIRSLKYA